MLPCGATWLEKAGRSPPLVLYGYCLTVGYLSARFRDDGCQPNVGAWAASQRTSTPVCSARYLWVSFVRACRLVAGGFAIEPGRDASKAGDHRDCQAPSRRR
jgi:hypothetical protein